jgi:ABC-type nickel/cobalt efflux system permease component RcnA
MEKYLRHLRFSVFSCIGTVLLCLLMELPGLTHWADMSTVEIWVGEQQTQMTLTYPTELTEFADDDRNGQLSATEIRHHTHQLHAFFGQRIRLTDTTNQPGTLTLQPLQGDLSLNALTAPNTHTTLKLIYDWAKPIQGLQINYNVFLPGVSTASCLATILQSGQLKTFVFTPTQQTLALIPGWAAFTSGGLVLAIAGAFFWGAVHSMSPGHGKTVVAAYQVGQRATPKHAISLAVMTTVTHTIGVFALGLFALFATKFIVPEQLYPWLSLISGGMVALIGLKLARARLLHSHLQFKLPSFWNNLWGNHFHLHEHRRPDPVHVYADSAHQHLHFHAPHSHNHSLDRHAHAQGGNRQQHGHDDIDSHRHHHKHHHHWRNHLPPEGDHGTVTWKNLVALGVSGGLVPCPAALVLLLSTIALGQVTLGLVLVLAFSLGLTSVLMGLGLLMVYAQHLFRKIPAHLGFVQTLPILSAIGITLIGLGISLQALLQVIEQFGS